jgi:hypothetical protein
VLAELRPFADYLADAGGDYDTARAAYIRDVVDAAPPLTAGQIAKLQVLLSP